MKTITLVVSTLLFFFCGIASADVYKVDPSHSEIGFSVKHMVITNVRGAFREYSGSFTVDGNNMLQNVNAEVSVNSIDTRIQKRDDHLRSPDFFEVDKFPTIAFVTKAIQSTGQNRYTVEGELTIRDVTKKVSLDGELIGPVNDPWGNQRMGIVLTGEVDRRDFGLTYNKVLETGGLLIGNEVKIHLEGEGILQK